MEPDKKSNLIKILIIVGALVIAGLIIAFGFYPIYQSAQAINQQIATKNAEETALKQRLEDLKELENNYEEAKSKATVATQALPTDKDEPELLVQLQNIAGGSGMGFAEVTPGGNLSTTATAQKSTTSAQKSTTTTVSGSIYQELPITVKIVGNFTGLVAYLQGIEKNLRILDVSAINITKDPQNKVLKIDIATTGYFQIPK